MVLIFKKMIAGRNIPKNLITRNISRQEVTKKKKNIRKGSCQCRSDDFIKLT